MLLSLVASIFWNTNTDIADFSGQLIPASLPIKSPDVALSHYNQTVKPISILEIAPVWMIQLQEAGLQSQAGFLSLECVNLTQCARVCTVCSCAHATMKSLHEGQSHLLPNAQWTHRLKQLHIQIQPQMGGFILKPSTVGSNLSLQLSLFLFGK